jgi:CelD/BcsL family acetyltransferase involved in cellulose biosynthesis
MGLRAQRLFGLPKAYAFALSEAASALATLLTDSDDPQSFERPRRRRVRARTVKVEVVRGAHLAKFDADWRDLAARADSPNVFMQPRVLRAAEGGRPIVALLAFEPHGDGRRLVGFWAFSVGTPHLSLVPITALCAPATEHAYLSAPVIDSERLEVTLHAMLDAIAAAPDLPKLVALESMSGSGATYEALLRVLGARMSRHCCLDAKMRPTLLRRADAVLSIENLLSSGSRKKLRQHRRRLGEKGRLETTVVHAVADVQRAFEAFLLLEAKGWKGRRGTAMLCDPQIAAFARSLVTSLARAGDAAIYALELDGRPISMQVVLRAGAAAFTWKTAYDEGFSEFSPGVLLFEDYTRALLADPGVALIDSCAYDDTGYMAAWSDRQEVIDLWIDAQRGGSAAFAAAVCLQKVYLPLRETAKHAVARSGNLETLARSALALLRSKQTRNASAAAPAKTRSAANGLVRAT